MEVQSENPSSISTQQKLDTIPSSPPPTPLSKFIIVASIAVGIQFGWALQFSLLTPYVQLLGIPHKWAAFIWLCGPISGMIVQPVVGFYSDHCTSRLGRRRPFIAVGAACVAVAVFLIGYAADIGHRAGDSLQKTSKPRAIVLFVVGFWILDVANNMLQCPCRALLADLSENNAKKTRKANAFFSFFFSVGSVLGYAAGSYKHLYKVFPFTKTQACDIYCANLKTCFFISIALLATFTVIAFFFVKEKRWSQDEGKSSGGGSRRVPFFGDIIASLKVTRKPMWILLLASGLNSVAWFPFFLFDTDWMGREVYGGKVGGTSSEESLYNMGVRVGAMGLMLNSVVVGVVSLGIETLGRWVGGVKRLWGVVNIFLAICLAMTVLVTKLAASSRHYEGGGRGAPQLMPPPGGVKAGALALFAVLGIPLAITYSVPFALASIFCSNAGAGQGLSLAVLNLSIVIPQLVVSLVSGPWDSLFGGGNLPAFVVGAVAAAAAGFVVLFILPSPPPDLPASKTVSIVTSH